MTRISKPWCLGAICLAVLLVANLSEAAEGPQRKTLFQDPRSGESTLKRMLGTTDLSEVRKRALEIGPREKAKERAIASRARALGLLADAAWVEIGPRNRPGFQTGGAADSGLVSDIALHPTDPQTIWVGTSGGGVWKTTDGGATWRGLMDNQTILPIGAVAVARSQPQRVYAGVGHGDTSSWFSNLSGLGVGLLISSDGGETWRRSRTSPGDRFFELLVDPANPDVILAGTNLGVLRSTDGGDTWSPVAGIPSGEGDLTSMGVSLSRAANPSIVFAATFPDRGNGRVWKSTDGGVTFSERNSGLAPIEQRGRGEIAVAPSDPNRVYVLFDSVFNPGKGKTLDMFRSTDGGETWTPLGLMEKTPPVDVLSKQGSGFNVVAVDPKNPDIVYAGGFDMWKTTDGGNTWAQATNWWGVNPPLPYLHADHHQFTFSSDGSTLFLCTDGGLFKTTDGAQTIQSLNPGLATMQFYKICQSPLDPNLIMGGAQDNGTSLRVSGADFREPGIGGDGFACFMSGTDPKVMLGSAQSDAVNSGIARSTDGGATFNNVGNLFGPSPFGTLIRKHPVRGDWVYTRSNTKIFVSKDNGATWAATSGDLPGITLINDFGILGSDGSRIVVAGAPDKILESVDGGATWAEKGTVPDLQGGNVAIRYDRADVKRLFLVETRSTATPGSPAESLSRVLLSTDGGATWARSQAGLPELPVFTIEQDVLTPATWYAGTYIGVYRSTDGGLNWQRYGTGLPNVIVTDMDQRANGLLRIATFGRGFWEIQTTNAASAPVASFSFSPASPAAGQAVTFTDTSTGGPTSWEWTFGDETKSSQQNPVKTYESAGTFTVTLKATNAQGTSTVSKAVTVTGGGTGGQTTTLFVPIVLSSGGSAGAFYSSEMTLTNRGTSAATITYEYTQAFGGGSGTGTDTLGAGQQRIVADAISYLQSKGVPLPDSGNRGGTLRVTFSGLSSASAAAVTVRTATPVPPDAPTGRAGLAYSGVPASQLLSGPAWLCGLRQDGSDRTNVAVQNAGASGDGDVRVRLSYFDGSAPSGTAVNSVEETLTPGGFKQFTLAQVAGANGTGNGFVKVERVSGTAPYYAYAVINDNANSDGSFVPPVPDEALVGVASLTLPVVVETSVFSTEVMVTNLGPAKTVKLTFVANGVTGGSTSIERTLRADEQILLKDFVNVLRTSGAPGMGDPGTYVGALFATVPGGNTTGLVVSARTGNDGGGGRYGLFYSATPAGRAFTTGAWLYALQQNGENRTNLALVNTGEAGTGANTFLVEVYSGASGAKVGERSETVGAMQFKQLNTVLDLIAPGTTDGYVKVTRTDGTNPFLAYAVVNDGAAAGQRSGDGAYIAAVPE